MSRKTLIWIGLILGSALGGFTPLLWGADPLSLSAAFLSFLGGALGIWAVFKISG